MNFSDVAILREVTNTSDSAGNFTETHTDTDVFVNVYQVGLSTWLAAQSAGLHADAEIQLRTLDYSGQQRVVLKGIEYEVERVEGTCDFTRLTLRRRLNNA